ncbi:MAG: phosphatidylinositol mannoside acyltransferase [Actinomycetaceae bacterium]|nr:phosphatidylinositol mannoside acyltransferase [Actinomycetaceae bacterium]
MNTDNLLLPAFRALSRVPRPVCEHVGHAVGRLSARVPNDSVRQLAKNHARILGQEPSTRHLREAVASYFTMFAQTPHLSQMTDQEVHRAVTSSGTQPVRKGLDDGPVVVALTHSGNWDLAGAWASRALAPVVTVAEKLTPPELYDYFVSTREHLGMEILGAERGVFHSLVDRVRDRHVIVPLLADRDITGSGIEVELAGHRALVAAGPAALARRLNCPLFAGYTSYRRDGRNRLALHVTFVPVDQSESVEETTQRWVSAVEPLIREHLVDWHMMQPLFVEDLDPARLARARERHALERARDGEL